MDVKFNSEVSSTTTTTNGVNSEIGEKEFTQSLNNPTNVSDVTSVVQAQEEKATTDEPQSQIVDVDADEGEAQAVDTETTRELVAELNLTNVGLSFSVDEETDHDLINVRDRDTDDLIRQIPSEEFLRVVKSIKNFKENAESGVDRNTLKGMILSDDA